MSSLRHDLRTPLNQIIGYSEMLQEEAAESGQERFVPDLERIRAAAHKLLAMIDRLTDGDACVPVSVGAATPEPVREAPSSDVAAVPGAVGRQAGDDAAPAHGTLLVVDDDEANRDMLSRRLQSRGYTVAVADGGRQALAKIETQRFDLVLLDVMMPEVSGLEVLKTLRRTHGVADLPVIMATARDQGEDIVEALRLGANDYVTKPLDFPVVLARTETQLSLKRAMEEIRRLAQELERRNRFIRHTFGRYLSDEVVESLLETPEGLRLGGEKRSLTMLMADLRGFTSMAETLAPDQVVRILNNYLGTMAEVIQGFQGTVDEFIGDAILALFGAPVARDDDAERGAACAVAMQLALAGVNERNRAEGLPELEMGIALNTGEVIVGNIGSERRTKYGVVGSHVNLTARIESQTVGGQVLVSESTLSRAAATLEVADRRSFQTKGFKDPITVYDLRGVGGRHKLHLSAGGEALQALRREIPISLVILEGKEVVGQPFEGHIVRASQTGAALKVSRAVRTLSNIRIRVRGFDGAEVPEDLYAKVVSDSEGGAFRVRFTSQAPLVAALIRDAMS